MATTNGDQLTFDEVLDRVLAADPQSFYAQAKAFEEAAHALDEARSLLAKHRRWLDEGWTNRAEERFVRLDQLARHLEVMMGDLPAYPRLLRRAGDVLVDSRQRLLALRHVPANADAAALGDRDKQARKILGELSTTYRQIGAELPKLPERTPTGQLVETPLLRRMTYAGSGGGGGGAGAAPVQARSSMPTEKLVTAHGAAHGAAHEPHGCGEAPQPVRQAEFGRFAQYATRPAPAPASGQKPRSFGGFSGLVDPVEPAGFVLGQQGARQIAVPANEGKGQPANKHAVVTDVPAGLDLPVHKHVVVTDVPAGLDLPVKAAGVAPPVQLEAGPVAPPPVAAPPVVTPPATTAAPPAVVTGGVPQTALATTAPPAPLPPPAPPVAAAPVAPAPPPGPPPAPATSGPQANPFAMSPNGNMAPGAANGANMMRPPLGGGVPMGVTGGVPIGRGPEVWLRADSSDWSSTHQAPSQLGRDEVTDHHVLGSNGGNCATEHGKEAR